MFGLPDQVYATKWRLAKEEGLPQPPLSAGFTYELCAGIVDKNKSLEAIAQEEVTLTEPQMLESLAFWSTLQCIPLSCCRLRLVPRCLSWAGA